MDTRRIEGKASAERLLAKVAAAVADFKANAGTVPGLCAVLIGNDPASESYLRSKGKAAQVVGIDSTIRRLPAATPAADLVAFVEEINDDPRIDGILVQLPLPKHIDPRRIIAAVSPGKDVDGFTPENVGRLWSGDKKALVPCTAHGCLSLLREIEPDLGGAEAVILGRSHVVGKPMAALLLAENCTVTLVHKRSREVPALVRRADILVAAMGHAEMVRGAWLKPGVIVIDVGINRVARADGGSKIIGDVAFAEAQGIARAITPVPGGVGPMTIACLLRNTVIAACRRRGLAEPAL
jgi:methylenetetrahydrofolate dehydrogenase (NADP+) / methenyltetrahydrofolate cyclohydrolase